MNRFGLVLILLVVGCASSNSRAGESLVPKLNLKTPVYDSLTKRGDSRTVPAGGSYAAGEKLFSKGNPEEESRSLFSTVGPQFIIYCGYACNPAGNFSGAKYVDYLFSKHGERVVPASTDFVEEEASRYLKLAYVFAAKFNAETYRQLGEQQSKHLPDAPTLKAFFAVQLGDSKDFSIAKIKEANAKREAENLFQVSGSWFIFSRNSSGPPIGLKKEDDFQQGRESFHTRINLPDFKGSKELQKASESYASQFNQKMLELVRVGKK